MALRLAAGAVWAAWLLLTVQAAEPCGTQECLAQTETLVEEVEAAEAAEAAALRVNLLQISPAALGRKPSNSDAAREPVTPADVDTSAAQEASVAQDLSAEGSAPRTAVQETLARQFREADKDADGLLTETELLESLFGEERPAEVTESKWHRVFALLDLDGDGRLDDKEAYGAAARLAQGGQETAGGKAAGGEASARELALLTNRATRNSTRTRLAMVLDEALTWKAEDPRCAKAPEGWLCLSPSTMIYCSAKKRLYDERSCGWKGTCQAGILGSAGCWEPMCQGRESGGTYCAPEGVYGCNYHNDNGRPETKANFQQPCRQCIGFPDGPPPSRRRRTCNGGMDCTFCRWNSNNNNYGSSNNCYSDAEDPPWATCT